MRGWYRWMCTGFPSLKDRIVTGTPLHMGYCPERQRGNAVNVLIKFFGGSSPSCPTKS